MSATSASSIALPSLKPKTLFFFPTQNPFHFPYSLFPTSSINVVVSSEYDQEEELFGSDDGERARTFSPDLKLFVGNLPFSVDSAQLVGLFGSAGNVEMVKVIYDKITRRNKGFAFVITIEEVEAVAQQVNGYELEGRARGSTTIGASTRVYVGNLSWDVDDLALETLFSEQGKVVEVKVVYNKESGRSRGFGFVIYNSVEAVDSAIKSLNGFDLDGRPIRVSAAESRPRRQL
ncbi:hypothetical protein CRYUN_Cryun07bG0052400 [Craigia yunnanensis]